MRVLITAHRDHLCHHHNNPTCHVCHVRFTLEFMTILVGNRPWVALPTHVFHMDPT